MRNSNQLNFLRFFAAFLVFYGHGLVLIGSNVNTILNHKIGLYIFFIISGYLISASWDNSKGVFDFFIKRVLRIFPALIVVVLLSLFLLGPMLTTLSVSEYFSNLNTWMYLWNIALYINYYLPGVFENNIVPNAVNGSLWSLPVEFLCYTLVAVLGVVGRFSKYIVLVSFIILSYFTITWALVTSDVIVFYGMDLKSVIYTMVYFFAGACLYHFKVKKYFSFEGFVLSVLLLIFLYQWQNLYEIAQLIILPFLVLSFGFSNVTILSVFNRVDCSYGFYIYAFPVQQTLYYLYPDNSIVFHLVIGFLLTIFLALASWFLVEKPLLKFKPK